MKQKTQIKLISTEEINKSIEKWPLQKLKDFERKKEQCSLYCKMICSKISQQTVQAVT